MIMDYIFTLFGQPQNEIVYIVDYCLGAYIVIYLLKIVAGAVFRVIGIERRKY